MELKKLLNKYIYIILFVFHLFPLLGSEWKKEVQNCGEEICFILNDDEEVKLVGSLMWAKEAVISGKELFYDRYFYEAVSLSDDVGNELHIYGPTLEETGKEWANTFPEISFNDFFRLKIQQDEEFAEVIHKEKVRYFNDDERQQTEVHFKKGKLWQRGLDSGEHELTLVPEGVYAFVLGEEKLYLTPKIVTMKGKIQHSSFFRGGPVLSAGKISIGVEGDLLWMSNDSGHYRPEELEVVQLLNFINQRMSKKKFNKVWIRIKPAEAWNPSTSIDRNYDLKEVDKKYDLPVRKWLRLNEI